MRHHPLIWSFNTITQKQFKYDPAAEIVHKGPLIDILDKLLPSMGRRDIPSHVVAIIDFHGPGVLEMPGEQRWDGLRLHYRNDSANLILDYDAYKSNLSVTSIKQDGTVSIESMSELKLDKKFNEEDKMKDTKPEMNVPLRWLGESEMNPEAIEYAKLDEPSAEADLVDTVEDGDMETHLRKELRRARDRTNTRISAVGAVVGSHDAVVKASNALKEFMADKEITPIVPDAERIGQLRTIDATDMFFDAGRLHDRVPRLAMLKVRSPNAEFDGDEMHANESAQLRHFQWRTRNPSIKAFLDEGRELYEDVGIPLSMIKTDYIDYQWLVKLVRRDIYRNAIFLSPALLVKTLHLYPGVVGADRKTVLRAIKKTYKRCISKRLHSLYNRGDWELKDRAIRDALLDWGTRDYARAVLGMQRRQLINDNRTCPTLTRQCMTGGDKV